MQLDGLISQVKGAGEARQAKLKRLGVETVRDLLLYTPFRYEDFSRICPIKDIKPGPITIKGKIKNINQRRSRKSGLHITQAVFDDGTGAVEITWFNQPYRAQALSSQVEYYLSGDYKFNNDRYSIINPDVERSSAFNSNTARIRGVYPETKGLRSSTIRKLVYEAMKHTKWDEDFHSDFLKEHKLLNMNDAIANIHFPENKVLLESAQTRFQFNELFEIIMASNLIRKQLIKLQANKIPVAEKELKEFTKRLPFDLTNAQRRASWEVIQDLNRAQPMNRLLEGDVGSGKTVVAALAAVGVMTNGGQVCIVAPTEIVAQQHYFSFSEFFGKEVKLLTSSTPNKTKSAIKNKLIKGEISMVVGTHALLQPDVRFKQLDLLVIDEQHRFGVKQRQQLSAQQGLVPHVLSMTATPIPRTLALTVYSDLDVSVIDELPPGRKKTITNVYGPEKRAYVYSIINQQMGEGHQTYVVCPLIDESDKLGVASVDQETKRIKNAFKKARVASLHGSLKPQEKESIVDSFKQGEIDILVSTTVVEVGVNVPDATVMLIEGAERFGLAQLHQLRGRVGRASHQAYCFALTTKTGQARQRLAAFESIQDGFELAERDLQQRGGGQLLGTLQSGQLSLKHASFTDQKMVKRARMAAEQFDARYNLSQYPQLKRRVEQYKTMRQLN